MVSDSVARATRAAHDIGLAAWLGGSMYGKFALNPAVSVIDDKTDRGKVTNAAWSAYNAAAGWAAARATETRPDRLSDTEQRLSLAKDALMSAAVITGIATGVQGGRLAKQAPHGAVPMETGTKPAPETPPQAAKLQRSIEGLSNLNILSGLALVAVNAILAQVTHSRPPAKRALLRRS